MLHVVEAYYSEVQKLVADAEEVHSKSQSDLLDLLSRLGPLQSTLKALKQENEELLKKQLL